METAWSKMWEDSGEDDEDYDPLKDPLSKHAGDDSGSDDFDGLLDLLSPSRKSTSTDAAAGSNQEASNSSGGTGEEKGSPDVIWKRTRRRVQLPDEVWKDSECQLEMAEKVLDPQSPNDACTEPTTRIISTQEYQHLLAVARGQAEPEDAEEDEDDEDFVPESDADPDGAGVEDEHSGQVSVSKGELSDLIAENRDLGGNGTSTAQARKGKRRRNDPETSVRVVADAYSSGAIAGGFSRDQCIQLQGQMREYFQLAAQQYVLSCCDKENVAERADDIRLLYDGLADIYRIWEVTTEYSKIQEKAMRILTDQIIGTPPGTEQAVTVRTEPRFSFFNLPGIDMVPVLLQRVSEVCTGSVNPQEGPAGADCEAAKVQALNQAQGLLSMFDPYFNPDLKLSSTRCMTTAGISSGAGGGSFTCAEDNLLLTGLRRFGTDWNKIHLHVLPTKTPLDLRARYRRLVRREEPNNPIKEWKFAHAAGLSEKENEMLHKGVQYFGARFDLISEKIIVNRTEEELRRAYAKLVAHSKSSSNGDASATRAPSTSRKDGRKKNLRGATTRSKGRAGRKSQVNSLFLDGGSSSSDEGSGPHVKRCKVKRGAAEVEDSMSVGQLCNGGFEQEDLADSEEEEEEAGEVQSPYGAHANGVVGSPATLAPLNRAVVSRSHPTLRTPDAPRASEMGALLATPLLATPGASSGIVMLGQSILSDSDSLPVFDPSTDGNDTRLQFRSDISETSNDAWLVSASQPQNMPRSVEPSQPVPPVTPAVDRQGEANSSLLDSSAGKSSAPTPFTEQAARAAETTSSERGGIKGWSEEQDLEVLMAGKAAAQEKSPSAYEDAWKMLNRHGSTGVRGRCVKELAHRYEVLVSKAINFSRSTTTG